MNKVDTGRHFCLALISIQRRHSDNEPVVYVYKTLMNSLYGRFGINPESVITKICGRKRYDTLVDKERFITAEELNDGYNIISYVTDNDSELNQHRISAIQFNLGNELPQDEISSVELGKLKFEHFVLKGYFLAPKTYTLITQEKGYENLISPLLLNHQKKKFDKKKNEYAQTIDSKNLELAKLREKVELLSVGKHLEELVMSTLSDPKEPVMSPLPELQPPTHYKPFTKDKKKKQNPKVDKNDKKQNPKGLKGRWKRSESSKVRGCHDEATGQVGMRQLMSEVKNVDGAVRAELAALEALIATSTPSTSAPPAFQPYVPAIQAIAPLSTQSGPFTFA
ncbi:hypothetical protein Q3G72_008806 [Acer saccharum]|nr:hypothetical protein Q3G72_008806 [Acer saccharum]